MRWRQTSHGVELPPRSYIRLRLRDRRESLRVSVQVCAVCGNNTPRGGDFYPASGAVGPGAPVGTTVTVERLSLSVSTRRRTRRGRRCGVWFGPANAAGAIAAWLVTWGPYCTRSAFKRRGGSRPAIIRSKASLLIISWSCDRILSHDNPPPIVRFTYYLGSISR